jgi:hypothetical protein
LLTPAFRKYFRGYRALLWLIIALLQYCTVKVSLFFDCYLVLQLGKILFLIKVNILKMLTMLPEVRVNLATDVAFCKLLGGTQQTIKQ